MKSYDTNKRLGIALVGLGTYSKEELAPALEQTVHCYLAGIVTGSEQKAKEWKEKYDIPQNNIYNYENFDDIKNNAHIDIIYIVLPNALHAEFVERAAFAGKHVICEKPMAITVADCDRMISACEAAGKKLSIGYRLHFEPHNLEMMRIGQENRLGNIQKIVAEHGMEDTEGWRINAALAGGGPLMDVGIYCVQACRYVTGLEPVSVTARELPKSKPEKFNEVEEALSWEMEFPGGLRAFCKSSYSEEQNLLRIETAHGWAELKPAFQYNGIEGQSSKGKMDLPQVNQQARQMDDFALSVKNNRPTPVPGEMGKQDVKILQAIYESMRTGKTITLD